jgi:NAD(P)-dependent dehydrogenase (short-subunit alcohol dehydrogenase family)
MDAPQTWFITGANRGLGRALTVAALDIGHAVFATVRGEHSLPESERLHVQTLDVRIRDDARQAVARAVDRFGRVDVLVNNAGYGLIGAIEEVTEAEARAIMDTDLFGPVWLSQAAVPVMREQGAGHIVQISTTGAVGSMPTLGMYNAAKWALEGFSEALSAEVAGFGIRVTLAELGETDTEWATASLRFSTPIPAYDTLRTGLFGSAEVPWPQTGGTGGGTPAADAAAAILRHVADPSDTRLRLLVGDDAPGQVVAALNARRADYARDARFVSADAAGAE